MWAYFDPYLMVLFDLTGFGSLDGLIGTFLIAFLANVVGEFTISIVFRLNRKHLDGLNDRLAKYGTLSEEARRRGDKPGYRALNRQANDAYGQLFFNRFGLSAASLWPAFFALDWMQLHFSVAGIVIPLFPSGANYVAVFLFCYIAARIVFGRMKRHLPYFKGQYAMLLEYENRESAAAGPR